MESTHTKKVQKKKAQRCLDPINNFLVQQKKSIVKKVVFWDFPTPEQGTSPDCLLYVRYFMKKFSCYNLEQQTELSLEVGETLKNKIQGKRVRIACKLLTAEHPEEIWKPSFETDYYIKVV